MRRDEKCRLESVVDCRKPHSSNGGIASILSQGRVLFSSASNQNRIMPTITGVLETALYVADLNRAEEFYRRVFNFPVLISDQRMRALRVPGQNAQGHQVLLLFLLSASTQGESTPGGFIPPHDGKGKLHMAFSIAASELDAWRNHLREIGVEIESEVQANNGHSLYFRDLDGHLLELTTPGLWDVEKN